MAKAGDQYEFRTGNIWNYANRDDLATVRRLISEGIRADIVNKVGWTPLHAAAFGGAERVLSHLLLREAVDSNPACNAGRTPLMDAARGGHLGCVKALVKAGASLVVEDHGGSRALDYAKGEAVSSWLSQRTPGGADKESTTGSRKTARGGRGQPHPGGGGGGGGKHEAVAERQTCGASGKQKAALLKQKRSEAQAHAQAQARGEARAAQDEAAAAAAAAKVASAAEALAAATVGEPTTADGLASEELAVATGGVEAEMGASGTSPHERGASPHERGGSPPSVLLAPPGPGASIEERRRYAYEPLAREAERSPPPVGSLRTFGGPARPFCLELREMRGAALDLAASYATASEAAAGGPIARRVAVIVADARHPLVCACSPTSISPPVPASSPSPPPLFILLLVLPAGYCPMA